MITADLPYTQPPAIVRRRCDAAVSQGDDGRLLEATMDIIRRALEQSQEWRAVIQASALSDVMEEETAIDVSSLALMPPKRTYTARATFHFAGRGEPLPYDFGDIFDDEEAEG